MATQTQTMNRLPISTSHIRFDPYARPGKSSSSKWSTTSSISATNCRNNPTPAVSGICPPQYALPLRSIPPNDAHKDVGGHGYANSEYLLRRKTPSGTLTAAYDATPARLNSNSHVPKHLLLPTDSDAFNTNRSWKFGPSRVSNSQASELIAPVFTDTHFRASTGNLSHVDGHFSAQSFSSRLANTLPVLPFPYNASQPGFFHIEKTAKGNAPFVANVMQPAYQAQLGPTVSNDLAPFGPYWPDGAYAPYQPASIRDPHFRSNQPLIANRQLDPPSSAQWSYSTSANSQTFPGLSGQFNNAQLQPFSQLPYTFDTSAPGQFHQKHFVHGTSTTAVDNSLQGHSYTGAAPTSQRRQPSPGAWDFPSVAIPKTLDLLSQQQQHDPLTYSLDELEELSSWANAIYTNLVSSIQQAKKFTANTRQIVQPSVNIYPEPTRKQGPGMFSGSNSSVTGQQSHEPHGSTTELSTNRASLQQHSSHYVANNRLNLLHTDKQGERYGDVKPHTSNPNGPIFYPPHPSHSQVADLISNSTTIQRSPKFDHTDRLSSNAVTALNALTALCYQARMEWIDGMLLAGCLAYVLSDYQTAAMWYSRIIERDDCSAEALSNLAATYLALDRRCEAEEYWKRAVRIRPSYFEAAEHLVGLLCSESRQQEAIQLVDAIQASLVYPETSFEVHPRLLSDSTWNVQPAFEYSTVSQHVEKSSFLQAGQLHNPSGPGPTYRPHARKYAISLEDNGRLIALVHAKGNILYNLGNHKGAAVAFEEVVLIATGCENKKIEEFINFISSTLDGLEGRNDEHQLSAQANSPLLLTPEKALQTARVCFAPNGLLPGLIHLPSEQSRKAAVSITSNSLLSLAKIFQDSMSSSPSKKVPKPVCGVRDILALYYLSLSLQPSPSTANNVGILLASVQQSTSSKSRLQPPSLHTELMFPGVLPGSGVALALTYYQYGLSLDSRHAHLFTNLGSLLKDIGQLSMAIKMYEKAVACDGNFDIALANLANAVKDQGRTGDAIKYYKKAVDVNPNFAEAVCGLANALNSICNWSGRGGVIFPRGSHDRWHVDNRGGLVDSTTLATANGSGWTQRVIEIVNNQLLDGQTWGCGILTREYIQTLTSLVAGSLATSANEANKLQNALINLLASWAGQKWEGARVVRFVERAFRRIRWQWYQDVHVNKKEKSFSTAYDRPQLPSSITVPGAPTVLPFHTFTFPMVASQIRQISQRNGLRMSCLTLRAAWLPKKVWPPPASPSPVLRVGYVSSDFNNHPLAHLMQSVFGMHDRTKVQAFCYATTASDKSIHRAQIEREAPVFRDVSSWSVERIVQQICHDGIHILVNLNGYTRGARNEIFAARPAPVQMSFMGFAGTLGAEWCDYLLADELAVPQQTLRPWRRNVDMEDLAHDENSGGNQSQWVYGENIVYTRNSFFCCDHRQSASMDPSEKRVAWDDEQTRRWRMRKELFPRLSDDAIILANFNQLYKIDPTTFRTWLRILSRLPNAVLWLLRFPDLGEAQLLATAQNWGGVEVAKRIIFTDVAPKALHIARACVADLFLDTPECNAHTTAADCVWSGTPLLTHMRWPWKMCSRMAAGILRGALTLGESSSTAGVYSLASHSPPAYEMARPASAAEIEAANQVREAAWRELVVESDQQYEDTAVRLCSTLRYDSLGRAPADCRLIALRRMLWTGRWDCVLFDTRRWVRELEIAYIELWRRWVNGEGGDVWIKDLV